MLKKSTLLCLINRYKEQVHRLICHLRPYQHLKLRRLYLFDLHISESIAFCGRYAMRKLLCTEQI